jgi:hypothetical protein
LLVSLTIFVLVVLRIYDAEHVKGAFLRYVEEVREPFVVLGVDFHIMKVPLRKYTPGR